MRECVILVADAAMEVVVGRFLTRNRVHELLGCAAFPFDPTFDLIRATGQTDPGLYKRAHLLLQPMKVTHRRAVVILDAAWEGSPGAEGIRNHIALRLAREWQDYEVVVIDPELENWIWITTPAIGQPSPVDLAVCEVLQCQGDLRAQLGPGIWPHDAPKPSDPKAAVERALRRSRLPRSSALYGRIIERISPEHCVDPAYLTLRDTFRGWFPAGGAA